MTKELLYQDLSDLEPGDLIEIHNCYCELINSEDQIHINDEMFFEIFFPNKPFSEVYQRVIHGSYNWQDKYVKFDGYANLESFNSYDIENHIHVGELLEHILENIGDYVFALPKDLYWEIEHYLAELENEE